MEKSIRVLHITEMLQSGGIESFIMNVYRNIDKSKVQFDFLLTRNEEEFYDEEVKHLGGNKLTIDIDKNQNVFKRVLLESMYLYKILKNSEYDIVHIHSGTPLRIMYLFAAKFAGVNSRIYHSHSAEVLGPHSLIKLKKFVFSILKKMFNISGTDFFACSRLAGEWMYTKKMNTSKKVEVIRNGIDVSKFAFNEEVREEYRNKLNVDGNIVIGHIGRFNEQKNHEYLIEVFKEIHELNNNTKLLLIGTGELELVIRDKVKSLGLLQSVIFLGVREDINKLMQAMDIFILPSHYEGLPVVGVEAQSAGLPVVMSENITDEVILTDNVMTISLDKSPKEWAKKILDIQNNFIREDVSELIIKKGYDIKNVTNELEKFYINKSYI